MNDRTRWILLGCTVLAIVAAIVRFEGLKGPAAVSGPRTVLHTSAAPSRQTTVAAKTGKYPMAQELQQPSGFVNTPPFKISDLIGKKVILVDFWTYSCINCQRTIPYLNAWYQKYKDQGLEIIGVHTPEFQFEHDIANVQAAVKKFGIQYPVVLDNDYATWNAYQNLYWPREYLIDIDGFIVHDHIGEGEYDQTEKAIQAALLERSSMLHEAMPVPTSITQPTDTISFDSSQVGSPETYFGAERNMYLANGTPQATGERTFAIPTDIQPNALYLGGRWNIQKEFAQSTAPGATITYRYHAKNMYFVAGAASNVTVHVTLDGQPAGTISVKDTQLYPLVQGSTAGDHTVELKIDQPGLQAFTFTFG